MIALMERDETDMTTVQERQSFTPGGPGTSAGHDPHADEKPRPSFTTIKVFGEYLKVDLQANVDGPVSPRLATKVMFDRDKASGLPRVSPRNSSTALASRTHTVMACDTKAGKGWPAAITAVSLLTAGALGLILASACFGDSKGSRVPQLGHLRVDRATFGFAPARDCDTSTDKPCALNQDGALGASGSALGGDEESLIRIAAKEVDEQVQRERLAGNSEWVSAGEAGVPGQSSLEAQQPGFVHETDGNKTLLRSRQATYVRLREGRRCADFGYFPVTHADACEAAAEALALQTRQVQVRRLGASAPEGCHVNTGGSLRLNDDSVVATGDGESLQRLAWRDHGIQQICSTKAYPTYVSPGAPATTTSTTVGSPRVFLTTTLYTTTRAMAEWEAQAPVNVRADSSIHSDIISQRPEGSVFLGWPEGSWLRLAGEPGYVKIIYTDEPLLFPRHVVYVMLSQGTCAEEGRYAIRSPLECQVAAQALSLPVARTSNWESEEPAPEGCFLEETSEGRESLWLALGNSFLGKGAVGNRRPICASRPLPRTPAFPLSTTTTTLSSTPATTEKGNPSMLCFAVLRLGTAEEDLIKLQLKKSIGIFACDDTITISGEEAVLGNDRWGWDVKTWAIPEPRAILGDLTKPGVTTNSWLNTKVFIAAFALITSDKYERVWKNDWLIKADPDAVIFPDRLRKHLLPHTGHAKFMLNCNYDGIKLFGAVEAFSKQAIGRYKDNFEKCSTLPWHGWGEDLFMQNCMETLGVTAVTDLTIVGDARCQYAPCSNTARAAFHPFKDVPGWWQCYQESTGGL
jgi:hypothetical protein